MTTDVFRKFLLPGCIAALMITAWSAPVWGQAQLADDLVILSKGQAEQGRQRDNPRSQAAPGSAYNRLGGAPAAGEARQSVARRDVLAAASAPPPRGGAPGPEIITAPPQIRPSALPPGGSLEVPQADEEGPADGLSLDTALDVIVFQNLTLQSRFQEISKADADILTAAMRGNPLVFGAVDSVPYGQYSPARPGETAYGITVIQPLDVNHKRQYRVVAAERAKDVTQAQFQDAVRLETDNLYTAFVDVLAAREGLRYVEASLAGLKELRSVVEKLQAGMQASALDVERVIVQVEAAELAREEAMVNLVRAKQNLALVLNVPPPEEVPFAIRGSIRTDLAEVPDIDQLIATAHVNRPDLRAFQLGVARADAEIDLAVKERYPDVFVLYSPWSLRDNTPTGGRDSTSWSISALASVPIFNRNQGNIRRAELSASQARTEWVQITRRIENEVQQAYRAYQLSLERVKRIDSTILPRAKNIRERTLLLLRNGEADAITYLQAQREYVDVVRQYRDALVENRRNALKVNTAVGIRLVH